MPPAESADDEDGAVIDHLKLPFPDMGNLSQIAKVGAMPSQPDSLESAVCCAGCNIFDAQPHNEQQGLVSSLVGPATSPSIFQANLPRVAPRPNHRICGQTLRSCNLGNPVHAQTHQCSTPLKVCAHHTISGNGHTGP